MLGTRICSKIDFWYLHIYISARTYVCIYLFFRHLCNVLIPIIKFNFIKILAMRSQSTFCLVHMPFEETKTHIMLGQ